MANSTTSWRGYSDQTLIMKRIVASLGVAALGAACIQESSAQATGAKAWTASVALRGFYDDNVNTTPTARVGTFGAEVSPTLAFELPMDQTTVSLAYTYSFKYYEKPPQIGADHNDQSHIITARLMHAFNERTTISIGDSFVIGQEPDVLRAGNTIDTIQRLSGENIRNYGNITLNHQFSPKFGMEVGYVNSFFDYEDNLSSSPSYGVFDPLGLPWPNFLGLPPAGVGISRSGLLDRIEQTVHLDARWTLQSSTIALVGYAISLANYTAGEPIGIVNLIDPADSSFNYVIPSNSRDALSHYVYVGAEHTFRPDLFGSLRVGARFTDYFNSPAKESGVSPYVAASLHYSYGKDGNLQVGLSHDRSSTDVFSTQGRSGSITTDAESTTIYGSITHRILPDLFGTLMGQFQNSTFNGGQFDSQSEQYYLMSVSLEYHINRHISTSVSYNFDRIVSDPHGIAGVPVITRGFDRNRIYVGATVTY